ncbi:hypothetical protein H5410_061956 [Solanum commersonii]|uniref:Uncharacterized protein n=1 Tax=Solanum commersonii TaxID=4109 RepID=A0A9J5WB66_SOLCO|nr:hypothetical protein H5410_061956 [Solanum commersonii]
MHLVFNLYPKGFDDILIGNLVVRFIKLCKRIVDEWMEIEMGNFFNVEEIYVEAQVMETWNLFEIGKFSIGGVEFQPK